MSDDYTVIKIPKPTPAQNKILRAVGTCVVFAGRRFGKALAIDTPIPTMTGWKTMGDLKVGDTVFDEYGKPTQVTFATEIMYDHKCYDVVFSDGSVITADADHEWITHTHAYRKALGRRVKKPNVAFTNRVQCQPHLTPSRLTTQQIKDTLYQGKRNDINHSIPLCNPLQYAEQRLAIHPYMLGVWLGDGDSYVAQIATNDDELIEHIKQTGYPVHKYPAEFMWGITDGVHVRSVNGQYVERSDTLATQLKWLNLIANKHIPTIYLHGSVDQRLELLKGLMDTDGTISTEGNCSFDNTNKQIAESVLELIISLGMKGTITTKRSTFNGIEHRLCYRVSFTPHVPVFKLTRKLNRQKLNDVKATQYYRYIVDVRECESVPVRCIQVNSPNHLYLAGKSCIPTHNTQVGVYKLLRGATTDPGLYWWVGLSWRSASLKRAWRLLKYYAVLIWKAATEGKDNGSDHIRETEKEIMFPNGSSIWMRTAEREDSLAGEGIKGVVVDEFSMMQERVWTEFLEATLLDYPNSWALFIGIPKGNNWASRLWQQAASRVGWNQFQFTTYDNPKIGSKRIDEIKANVSEALFNQEYLAMIEAGTGIVFRNVRGVSILARGQGPIAGHTYIGAIDWGKKIDYSVFSIVDIVSRQQVAMLRINDELWENHYNAIGELCILWGVKTIFSEDNSIGNPCTEALRGVLRLLKLTGRLSRIPRIESVTTSNSSKSEMVEHLVYGIEQSMILLLNDPIQIQELELFSKTRTPSGLYRYAAPDGWHDDTVIPLLFLWDDIRPKLGEKKKSVAAAKVVGIYGDY